MSDLRTSDDDHHEALLNLTISVMCLEIGQTDEHILGEIRGLQADLRETGALVDQQDRMLRFVERRDALVELMRGHD